jgi:hypothetical protein
MWLKAVEVGVVLIAGIAFAIWQFRDLRKARAETERQRTEDKKSTTSDADER